MNYYPHHIGDYLRDTVHLSALEDGTYRRMLDLYYASEKPLPVDFNWLCKLVRAREEKEREAVHEVLKQFFQQTDDGWRNKRADIEIKAAYKRAKIAKANGKLGGRPKTQRVISGLAKPNPNESSQYQYQYQNQTTPSGAFLRFWDSWPKGARKQAQGKCWSLWRQKDFDQIAQAVQAHVESLKASDDWQRGYVPAPLVYLNQRRWEGAEAVEKPEKGVAMP